MAASRWSTGTISHNHQSPLLQLDGQYCTFDRQGSTRLFRLHLSPLDVTKRVPVYYSVFPSDVKLNLELLLAYKYCCTKSIQIIQMEQLFVQRGENFNPNHPHDFFSEASYRTMKVNFLSLLFWQLQ